MRAARREAAVEKATGGNEWKVGKAQAEERVNRAEVVELESRLRALFAAGESE